MKGFKPEETDNSVLVVHAFAAAPAPNVVLVDPEQQKSKVKQNDPQNLMKKAIDEREPATDEQLNKSLELAFSTGLFSFSEIIFDKGRRRAMVSYSFVCGILVGTETRWFSKKLGTDGKSERRAVAGYLNGCQSRYYRAISDGY